MKKFSIAGFFLFLCCATAFAINQKMLDHCVEEYEKNHVCPPGVCQLRCVGSDEDCSVKLCAPLECPQIPVQYCPEEFCAVMESCSKEKICHYKMSGEPAECGDLAYAGQDVACCKGLVKRCGIEFLDGTCDMEGKNSIFNIPICIPCGDGICGQFETRCNCPEDCH